MESDEAIDCQMDSPSPCLSPVSFGAIWRYYLRQEPGAVIPHAGICAGGAGQPAFLPRPVTMGDWCGSVCDQNQREKK